MYKKYLSALIFLLIIFTLIGVVTATDSNTTKETVTPTIQEENNDNTIITKETEKTVKTKKITQSDNDTEIDEGCCTTIVQGENNDSSVSFRRDTTSKATINVKYNDTILKQFKTDGSYFCHVMISKTGWVVGTGGLEGGTTCRNIESYSLNMINSNHMIDSELKKIFDIKGRATLAHYVIKAPNGTFNLLIKRDGQLLKRSGVLKPGEYVVVPNRVRHYQNGMLKNFKDEEKLMLNYSRMLSAHDRYGVQRRQILTYYFKNNIVNSSIKVTVSNDDGRHVGVRSGQYVDNIQTNTKYYPSYTIPVLDNFLEVENAKFFIRKARTNIVTHNKAIHDNKVELTGTITDEFGNKINTGKVSVNVDGKTLKYSSGKTIFVQVVNGTVKYKHVLKNLWSKKNHTYYMNYIENANYENSKSQASHIKLSDDFFRVRTYHNSAVYYGGKLTIKSFVRYNSNNTRVIGGKIIYKINGKTLLNSKNKTLYKFVKNGDTVYNHTFKGNYWAKTYVLTTVYVHGAYRKEYKTRISIKKIPARIISSKISVKNRTLHFTGKLVDRYKKTVKYDSYLKVKINGKYLKKNKVAVKFNIKNGLVNFKFKLPSYYKSGKNNLTVVIPEFRETLSYSRNYTFRV
ncbi:hypothetical protein PXD04_08765 [Methanosphaera sp. ISO3-F5]|uniref:hypothetical protein n=1 Tax=Methanosphaera sp. ISO3-F5 TaxID=1452353 RepID=UPI002B2587AC|nr:hypothetical protein [Methanosphaera sp. ISO3-F5]WQH63781.1 hypothetical protein PXD04_08765 [Methanosphaera sp. ISO3-F5]